jgi:hypothetical protein
VPNLSVFDALQVGAGPSCAVRQLFLAGFRASSTSAVFLLRAKEAIGMSSSWSSSSSSSGPTHVWVLYALQTLSYRLALSRCQPWSHPVRHRLLLRCAFAGYATFSCYSHVVNLMLSVQQLPMSLESRSALTLPKFECLQQLIKKRIWSSGVALRVFLRFFGIVAGLRKDDRMAR